MPDSEIPKKKELPPIERFKNQNKLLRQFGETGLRVFGAVDGKKSMEGIMEESGCTEKEYRMILDFMRANGMLDGDYERSGQKKERAISRVDDEKGREDGEESGEEETENKGEPADLEEPKEIDGGDIAPGPEKETEPELPIRPKKRMPAKGQETQREDSPISIAPSIAPSTTRAPKTKEEERVAALSPLEQRIYKKYGEVGVKVYTLIDGEKTAEQILLETGISEVKLVEILEFLETEGIIKLEKPPGAGSQFGGVKPEGGPSKPTGFGDTRPEGAAFPLGEGSSHALADEGLEEKTESENEFGGKARRQAFGREGAGRERMENSGMAAGGDAGPNNLTGPALRGRKKEEAGGGFSPIVEEAPSFDEAGSAPKDEEALDIVPIDVPVKAKMGFITEARMQAGLLLKFKSHGAKIYEMLSGKKDVVQIALATRMSLEDIDSVLAYLGEGKAAYFKKMGRDEIGQKYGEDGLAVYKKFGREGVLLYELVGKEKTLKDVVIASRIAPKRAVDILLFVHSVLNLDVPINKEVLYKQLGLEA